MISTEDRAAALFDAFETGEWKWSGFKSFAEYVRQVHEIGEASAMLLISLERTRRNEVAASNE